MNMNFKMKKYPSASEFYKGSTNEGLKQHVRSESEHLECEAGGYDFFHIYTKTLLSSDERSQLVGQRFIVQSHCFNQASAFQYVLICKKIKLDPDPI